MWDTSDLAKMRGKKLINLLQTLPSGTLDAMRLREKNDLSTPM